MLSPFFAFQRATFHFFTTVSGDFLHFARIFFTFLAKKREKPLPFCYLLCYNNLNRMQVYLHVPFPLIGENGTKSLS